jgi:hypothetical protein
VNARRKIAIVLLPLSVLALGVLAVFGTACELVVNANLSIDGSVSDVLDCGICADVSADANYDAADVSIQGLLPPTKE